MFYYIKFAILKKEIKKEVTLKANESAAVDDLTITHKGGGYYTPITGGDFPYANLDLEIRGANKTERISIDANTKEKFQNGYLIGVKEMGKNGNLVGLSISRFQEESFEFGKEISLQKYRVIKNKDLKISFAKLEILPPDEPSMEEETTGIYIERPGNYYITLEVENSSGKTDTLNFNPNPEKTKWENYNFDYLGFDPTSESIKFVILK
jgi:hypothetical protein